MKQEIGVNNIYFYPKLGKYLFKIKCFSISLIFLISFSTMNVAAFAFNTCPTNAFLFEHQPIVIKGTNLANGHYQLNESSSSINANIHGLGFDEEAYYLYGFNIINFKMVRMDHNYQIKTLSVAGLPMSTAFYVGDVSKHYYYLYRKEFGLYKVDLSPLDNDITAQLTAVLIGNKSDINLTDIAFNPNDNNLYGVDNRSGYLYQISTSTGIPTYIGNSGEIGIFSSMHFDADGYFYLSRNQDAKIYKIDLSMIMRGTSIEMLTASGNNYSDVLYSNARCATIGDSANFVTIFDTGLNSVFSVYASREGKLNLWFDWNRDGDFDDRGEKTLTNVELQPGSNVLSLRVPVGSSTGSRWSSFSYKQ